NNVIVSFERQGTGIGATTDGTNGDLIFVNFKENEAGDILTLHVAHEGSHVADNQAYDTVASLGLCGSATSTDITLLDSERRAFNVSSLWPRLLEKMPLLIY